MEEQKESRDILCIDLKSFYASCECVARGLNPFEVPLAVVGRLNEPGSIVLAASPALKMLGAKSRCRAYELQKFKEAILVPCRMNHYLHVSKQILSIYLKYIAYEDMHVYSIDEVFLDVSGYLTLYKCDAYTLAKRLIAEIAKETGIPATCGIGPNLLLAKVALDVEAKTLADGIAYWTYADVPTKLWSITPLSNMWGIGRQLEKRLNKMGFYEVGDIAQCPLSILKQEFGLIGEQLYAHCHGVDDSRINAMYVPKEASISGGQVLMRDYYDYDIRTVLFEQVDDVMRRVRNRRQYCQVIHLAISYSRKVKGGFSKRIMLDRPSDLTDVVFEACWQLFQSNYTGQPIRKVNIQVSRLCEGKDMQLNLFEDISKKQKLTYATDEIRVKHGKNALLRAVSYREEGTARHRNTLMGGHQA